MLARPVPRSNRQFSHRDVGIGVAAFISLLAAVTLGACPAVADCPSSAVFCLSDQADRGGMTSTTSPTYSTICEGVILNVAGANFNVPTGTFEVYVGEGGNIDLWLRDAFTVTGPAAGSPIALHMRVRVHGGLNWDGACCPDSQAHVDLVPLEPQSGDPSTHWSFGKSSGPYASYPYSDSLDITLQRTAGQPIGIEIHAQSHLSGPDSGDLQGEFLFPDLPQGWTVASCKGYRKEQPVPATPMSWGHVKAAYR